MHKKVFLIVVLALTWVLGLAQPVTIDPPSAIIEPGGSVTLTASGATYYQWSPPTGLSTTEGPVTIASPMVTTTYTCEGYAPGPESVSNGDFSQGNVAFTSAYEYNTNLWAEGTYYVDSDASLHHTNFVGYGNGGSGNFMIVNGATIPQTNVWTEEITVLPNKYYAFSTWVCTLAGQANEVALLQFSINGTQIGEIFSAPAPLNTWEQFYELWYSGNSTSATITILNQNTVGSGNDFGLDDISFRELVLVGDPTCTVTVNSMTATANADETELCEGESTTLHALPANGSGNYSYAWTPANTLNDPNVQHPLATPNLGTTTYTCVITDNDWGSSQSVSVELTAYPTYDETTIDRFICPGETYEFYGTEYNSTCNISYTDHTLHGCDSIVTLNLTVWPENDTTLNEVSLCPEQLPYTFYGMNYYEATDVTYIDTDIHGCDSAVRLVLTVSNYYIPEPDIVYTCDESYTWNPIGDYQFTFTEDGVYIDTLPTDNCDGIFRLELFFMEEPEEVYYDPIVCESYTWPVTGQTYTQTCDDYYYESLYPFPCNRVHHLHLTVNQDEHLDDIVISGKCDSVPVFWFGLDTVFYANTLHQFTGYTEDGCYREQNYEINSMQYTPISDGIQCQSENPMVFGDTIAVVTNTEFFSFQYDFAVTESGHGECVWDSCIWSISKPSWIIEFDTIPELVNGKYYSQCKVYVAEREDNLVTLTATIKNECGVQENTFYLKSSFLDIDAPENAQANINVLPNPNKGQMTLYFEHLTGKIDVKVYDMTGSLIDQFEINNEKQTLPYNLSGSSGVYFFVATNREGTVVKKVVVNR